MADGNEGRPRDAEAARTVGLALAQDEHGDGHENEGEKGADVREVGERADVKNAGGNGDEDAGDPGGDVGRAEFGMHAGKGGREQAVARHGEPDAGLAELENEDRRDHAHQRAGA